MRHRVVVVGSANVDYSIRLRAFPAAGETLLGDSLRILAGGKGLNQAIAAARMAASVHFVGSVGADADGRLLTRTLDDEGVDTTRLAVDDHSRTGLATVYVLPTGQNSIVVVPGANSAIDPARVATAVESLAQPGDILVVQAEIPAEVLESAVVTGVERGMRAVINLAPYRPLPAGVLRHADPLVVNEVEAGELTGLGIGGIEDGLRAAAQLSLTSRSVVVTLGASGACWATDGGAHHLGGPTVADVIDTTGAGDAFVGALAALLADGGDLDLSTRIAVKAASISVTRPGAQESYARRAEVAQLQMRARPFRNAATPDQR